MRVTEYCLGKRVIMSLWLPNELGLAPLEFLTRDEIRAIEFNEFIDGKSAWELMQNAGKAVSQHLEQLSKSSFVFVIGPGNNGGDALVAASHLSAKSNITVILLKPPKTNEAKKAYQLLKERKPDCVFIETTSLNIIKEKLNETEVIIDGIFGIGLESQIREPYLAIINYFHTIRSDYQDIIISCVDIPSGLDCTTGQWYCEPYDPNFVVTMQFSKLAMKQLKSTEIITADIGFSDQYMYYVGPGHYLQMWPKRDPDSYKGKNGRVIVIGGSDGFTGAPVLAGMATLRTGVDSLRIAVPETIRDIVAGYAEDFIVLKVKGDKITSKGFNKYLDLTVTRHDVAVVGMGLSNHPECVKFVLDWFKFVNGKIKAVLDADAIRSFKGQLKLLENSGAIITPHKAELRTLVGESVPDDPKELIEFVKTTAKNLGIVILIKGRIDIITDGDRLLLNHTGHPGMTVGGTGDVLAGLVGAVNCFVEDKFYATAIASYIMGMAGESAAKKYGNSLLASDVVKEIPNVILGLEDYRDIYKS